jgi:hypothetical protein
MYTVIPQFRGNDVRWISEVQDWLLDRDRARGLDVSVDGQLHGTPGEENLKGFC